MFSQSQLIPLLISFFAIWIVILPLEQLFTARKQPIFRKSWRLDLTFYWGQTLLWAGATVVCLGLLSSVANLVVPTGFRAAVASQPWWLQALEVVFLGELLIYWGHRISHKYSLLWRFHSTHHTAEHLDWLAAYREHPIDGLYTRTIINLPAIVFGFPLHTIAGLIALQGFWGVFIHSNVRIPLGPLKYFLGAPQLHHWHHDKHSNSHCNFANLMPIMDVLFGTYHEPDHEPEAYGIEEPVPQNYLQHMLHPFLPSPTPNDLPIEENAPSPNNPL